MKENSFIKNALLIVATLLIAVALVKCTKQGPVSKTIDRSVATASMDSTIFSPFYDSTVVPYANTPADANDMAVTTGVLNLVKTNCSASGCHGGNVQPTLTNYAAIKNLVVAGSPETSKLWQLLTTNDLNKTMPPVNSGNDLSITDKNIVYNWIMNGAAEQPSLIDYRPAAVRFITNGCTSANCHSMPSVEGNWAKSGLLGSVASTDTATVAFKTASGTSSSYVEVVNPTLLASVWQSYMDSCYQYYASIANISASATAVGNTSFKSIKIGQALSPHGPLSTYDAIVFDITIPKGIRTGNSTDYLNGTNNILSRIDSSILLANPRTGVWAAKGDGGMASSDGGFSPSDVAIIKAWYFLDPNIPDVWKFGTNGAGIFKYANGSQQPITKH